jgi:hypothetical protein
LSRPLARVLRLRALLEEVSRIELEKAAWESLRIERARERENEMAQAAKREAFSLMAEADRQAKNEEGGDKANREFTRPVTNEGLILAEAAVDMAMWCERRLEPMAHAAMRRVEAGREEFFLKRKERQQVEAVLQDQAARCKVEQERRQQRILDDWFATKHDRSRPRGSLCK